MTLVGWHSPASSSTTVSMDAYVPRYRRVYVVDDHDIVRRGLRDLLVNAHDIDVVGDSGSVREAIPAIVRLEADVMLLDLHRHRRRHPETAGRPAAPRPGKRAPCVRAVQLDRRLPHPRLTESELRVLDQVVAGRTDSEIVGGPATRHPDAGADITALIARVTRALLGQGAPSSEPGGGRHRRLD